MIMVQDICGTSILDTFIALYGYIFLERSALCRQKADDFSRFAS